MKYLIPRLIAAYTGVLLLFVAVEVGLALIVAAIGGVVDRLRGML